MARLESQQSWIFKCCDMPASSAREIRQQLLCTASVSSGASCCSLIEDNADSVPNRLPDCSPLPVPLPVCLPVSLYFMSCCPTVLLSHCPDLSDQTETSSAKTSKMYYTALYSYYCIPFLCTLALNTLSVILLTVPPVYSYSRYTYCTLSCVLLLTGPWCAR